MSGYGYNVWRNGVLRARERQRASDGGGANVSGLNGRMDEWMLMTGGPALVTVAALAVDLLVL